MNVQSTPLARAFRLDELTGRWRKTLLVPSGRCGVVIDADGEVRTLDPGRHPVPRGAAQFGWIPANSFIVHLQAENLLDADDELVDASLLCEAEVLDAGRFFTRLVLPRGVIAGESLVIASEEVWKIFMSLTRPARAAELVNGLDVEQFPLGTRTQFENFLTTQGVYLDYIAMLSFWRTEDRLAAREKAAVLQERLKDPAMEGKLTAVRSAAQMAAVLDEVGLSEVGLRPAHEVTDRDDVHAALLNALQSWLDFAARAGEQIQRFRLETLWRRKKQPGESSKRRRRWYPRFWWLRRVIWIGFVVSVSSGVIWVINLLAGGANWADRWQVYLIVAGFAVGAVLDSLRKLYDQWEELQQVHWAEPGTTLVDDLVGQDRLQADALVRQQCAVDMENARQALNILRSRLFRQGDEETALQIRAFEKEIARAREAVLDPSQGVPPYVMNLKISRKVWNDLLDYDEALLVRSNVFGEDVQAVVQDAAEKAFDVQMLETLQASLDAVLHHFRKRSQALRLSEEEKQNFRRVK